MNFEISNKYAKIILQKATADSQIIKFVEETSELNQQLMKYLLYRESSDWKGVNYDLLNKIQSEIADVIVTLGTLIEVFDDPNVKHNNVSKIGEYVTFKLLRFMDRVKEWK